MFISPFPTPFLPRFLPKNYPLDMVGRGGYRGMRLELKSLLQYVQNNYIFWGGWNNFTPFQHSFLHTGVKIITLPLKMLFTCLFIFKSPFPEEFVYPPPRVWWGGESGGGMKNLKREKIVLDLFLGSRWYNLYIIFLYLSCYPFMVNFTWQIFQ